MTQTLASWGSQLRPLATDAPVCAVELRGQGQTELSLARVDLAQQAADLSHVLDALELRDPIDLCGFSFGGRVAITFAATYPQRIRRLIVTGVGSGRSALAKVILRGWQATAQTGDLAALGWVSLADTLGPAYLARHEGLLPAMVKAVTERNRPEALASLFAQTFDTTLAEGGPPTLPLLSEAKRVEAPCLALAGDADRLVPRDDLVELAHALGAEFAILAGSGHTAPIEVPEDWRLRVLGFLR